jgi:hypothetical protein
VPTCAEGLDVDALEVLLKQQLEPRCGGAPAGQQSIHAVACHVPRGAQTSGFSPGYCVQHCSKCLARRGSSGDKHSSRTLNQGLRVCCIACTCTVILCCGLPCRPKLLYTIPIHNNPAGTASLLLLGGTHCTMHLLYRYCSTAAFFPLACGVHVDAVVRQREHSMRQQYEGVARHVG